MKVKQSKNALTQAAAILNTATVKWVDFLLVPNKGDVILIEQEYESVKDSSTFRKARQTWAKALADATGCPASTASSRITMWVAWWRSGKPEDVTITTAEATAALIDANMAVSREKGDGGQKKSAAVPQYKLDVVADIRQVVLDCRNQTQARALLALVRAFAVEHDLG